MCEIEAGAISNDSDLDLAYLAGVLTAQAAHRKGVKDMAIAGSSPAQKKFEEFVIDLTRSESLNKKEELETTADIIEHDAGLGIGLEEICSNRDFALHEIVRDPVSIKAFERGKYKMKLKLRKALMYEVTRGDVKAIEKMEQHCDNMKTVDTDHQCTEDIKTMLDSLRTTDKL